MSFGQMIAFIDIVAKTPGKDAEGFSIDGETTLASVRAYKEDRHGSVAWKNRAAFSKATSLFRFRIIPGLTVTTAMVIVCKTVAVKAKEDSLGAESGEVSRSFTVAPSPFETIVPGETPVKAAHITAMRTAVNNIFYCRYYPPDSL